jgi:hypothetical protein
MSARMSRRSRALATVTSMATAVLVGGLLTAAPASSATETGPVTYSGTVTCSKAFPNTKSVPKSVTLDSDEDDVTGAAKSVEGRRAKYGPLELEVPLDSQFNLTVTVSCKEPRKKAQNFTRTIPQTDLTENEAVKLNIK